MHQGFDVILANPPYWPAHNKLLFHAGGLVAVLIEIDEFLHSNDNSFVFQMVIWTGISRTARRWRRMSWRTAPHCSSRTVWCSSSRLSSTRTRRASALPRYSSGSSHGDGLRTNRSVFLHQSEDSSLENEDSSVILQSKMKILLLKNDDFIECGALRLAEGGPGLLQVLRVYHLKRPRF